MKLLLLGATGKVGSGQSKGAELAKLRSMQKSLSYYMRANVFITTSGAFDQTALNCGIEHRQHPILRR